MEGPKGNDGSIAMRMRRFWSRSIALRNIIVESGDGVGASLEISQAVQASEFSLGFSLVGV